MDTESSIHLFLQRFETRGLLAISLKRPQTEKEKEEVERFGSWKEMSVLCLCLAEQKLLSAENIMPAFVCWKVAGVFGFQVSACVIEAGGKQAILDSLESPNLWCQDVKE